MKLALALVLLSLLEFGFWLATHHEAQRMQDLIDASQGVLQGTPHWRAYQNRLLGPALVDALRVLTAYPLHLYVLLMLGVANTALLLALRRLSPGEPPASRLTWKVMAISAVVWVLGKHRWSYPWDFLESLLLLAMAYLAFTKPERIGAFVLLFAVAILSRESALFIPVFMVLYTVVSRRPLLGRPVLCAIVLVVLGTAFVQLTRSLLFVHSMSPGVGDDLAHASFGNHWQLAANGELLIRFVTKGKGAVPLVLMAALLSFYSWAAVRLWRLRELGAFSFALTMVAYLLALIPFAVLTETRIYQPMAWCTGLTFAFLRIRPGQGAQPS
ncbi:MAG TPA: hypothetical protein H9903_15985 [Candidatus Aquabacterium excrementipullorum]|nr:hypothetical protein [Candidatus Aquabacterium excrementipullorum]